MDCRRLIVWEKKFTKTYTGITIKSLWKAWSDVKHWPQWDEELEYCDISMPFTKGSTFILKPRGGPKVKVTLDEVTPSQKFIARSNFIGATMRNFHEVIETPKGIRINNIITVSGPLTFIWANLVAREVALAVPKQTDNLIRYISQPGSLIT